MIALQVVSFVIGVVIVQAVLRSAVRKVAVPRGEQTYLTRKTFQVEDLSTYFGSLRDVADPRKKAIPTGQVFSDLLNFPGWLDMADRNGHYFSRCFGRKVFSATEMPQDWQKLMAARHPDILRDPKAALGV